MHTSCILGGHNLSSSQGYCNSPSSLQTSAPCLPFLQLNEDNRSRERLSCTPSPPNPLVLTLPIQVGCAILFQNISNSCDVHTPISATLGALRLQDTMGRQSCNVIETHNRVDLVDLENLSKDNNNYDVPLNSSQCTSRASIVKVECSITSFGCSEDPSYNAAWKAPPVGAVIPKVEADWFGQIERRRQKKIEERRLEQERLVKELPDCRLDEERLLKDNVDLQLEMETITKLLESSLGSMIGQLL